MLDNLTHRLARVVKTVRGHARLTDDNIADALREVRMALLEADVALPVVKTFISRVKERAVGREVIGSLTPGQAAPGRDLVGRPAGFRQDSHHRQAWQVAQGAVEEEGGGYELRRLSACR